MTKDFSLVLGGPLYQLYLRARLARPPLELMHRRIAAFVAVTLLPPALLSALTGRFASGPVPFVQDLTNLQFVTTLPILVGAEVFIHRRLGPIIPEFDARDLVVAEDRARFDDAVAGAVRLRNSVVAELVLLVLAFTSGFWLWRAHAGLHAASWYAFPVDGSMRLTAAGLWLAFVSLPISRFVLFRWYFRLFIWYLLVWRVSRLHLGLNPLHADRAGGLGFLEQSVTAFAPVLVAQSAFFALVLGNQIWHAGARLVDLGYELAAFVGILVAVVLVPLTFFVRRLDEARRAGIRVVGRLAGRYADAFAGKWLADDVQRSERLLGTSDIQSLADLANSYDVVRTMKHIPVGKVVLVRLVVLVALPLLPLAFTMVPLETLAAALVNVVL